jgi:hypothetical protein
MTLNVSGPISLAGATTGQSIAVELGVSSTGTISLNDTNVRTLAGVASGVIVMPTNFYGKSNIIPFTAIEYTTAGSYTFTVPAGVTAISAVCVGGGSSGPSGFAPNGGGGGGGGLSYSNNISVTPGESLNIVVGVGGAGVPDGFNPGGLSSISRGATTLLLAAGGNGRTGGQASAGIGDVKNSGGSCALQTTGRGGGGGAAGYSGPGGSGGFGSAPPTAGSGGGGGGGFGTNGTGGGGGGVGLIVEGASGAAGTSTSVGGKGGSGGANGTTDDPVGGLYGGGGSREGDSPYGFGGANGGVRIIYGGTGKSYPNNSAP